MNILLTNDDGMHSEGLECLRQALSPLGRIFTVAPSSQRSGVSQALTIHDDIHFQPLQNDMFLVEGYPADCVNAGLHGGFINEKIDLVVSGINHGLNLGDDVHYSGTVGAARHAFIHGYPALAVSCDIWEKSGPFARVGTFLLEFIQKHEKLIFSPVLLNINFPVNVHPFRGIKWAKLGSRIYRDSYKRTESDRGGYLLNLGGSILSHREEKGTDFEAFDLGFASVTPLKLDATDYTILKKFTE